MPALPDLSPEALALIAAAAVFSPPRQGPARDPEAASPLSAAPLPPVAPAAGVELSNSQKLQKQLNDLSKQDD